ncbi:MAG: hypothetical protein ACK55Z_03565, partial [bacterium]
MEHPEQHEDAPPAYNRAVKLPPFWAANPRAWVTSAEGASGCATSPTRRAGSTTACMPSRRLQ